MTPTSDATDAVTPARARALRRRLLERVADADTRHLTITADEGDWQRLLPGVHVKVLHEQDGVMSYLLRLEPGAELPAHRHPSDEECLILDGLVQIGTRPPVGPGTYERAPKGALHAPLRSPTGATLFLRGATPEPDHVLE